MYTQERVKIICDALARGETQETAYKLAGIVADTYYRWLKERSEFSDAVKKAQAEFQDWQMNGILEDARKSLKTLICGQEHEEIKTEYENDKNGQPRIKKQTRVTKKILPNPTAVIFALCNRDPEHWKNRVEQEVSGKMEVEQTGKPVSLEKVPDALLAQVIDAINGK